MAASRREMIETIKTENQRRKREKDAAQRCESSKRNQKKTSALEIELMITYGSNSNKRDRLIKRSSLASLEIFM